MTAQMSAMQQQLTMQQGATTAMMQQSAAAMAANQHAPTPTASNRTNNRSGNWQQQAWTNMQQAPYCPPAGNTMPNSSGKAPTPYRWYENRNYCHTHGHHIENDHTSQTRKRSGPNHNQKRHQIQYNGRIERRRTQDHHAVTMRPRAQHQNPEQTRSTLLTMARRRIPSHPQAQ